MSSSAFGRSATVVVALAFVLTCAAQAAPPRLEQSASARTESGTRSVAGTVWFQGFLADSVTGDPINATYTVVARIYGASSGGTLLWGPETHNAVSFVEGWFNIELGSITSPLPSFDAQPYYLQLHVNGEALTPRLKLASVPSSLAATASTDLTLPASLSYSGTSAPQGLAVEYVGSGGSGDAMYVSREGGTAGAHAIYARSNSEGAVIRAWQFDTTGSGGPALDLDIWDSSNASPVVDADTPGSGPAYYGASNGPYAAELYASEGSGHVVHAVHDGTGEDNAVAVYGESIPQDGWGIGGEFRGGYIGVRGQVQTTGGGACTGVHGVASGGTGSIYALYGIAENSTGSNYGVYGIASGSAGTRYAGYFVGNTHVNGTLSKSSGAFKIDHPLDPEHKYLYHSFVESPDMMNVYNGIVVLDASGEASVEFPEWFEALNRDFRYQLTCVGGFAPVYVAEEISSNRFRIAGGEPGLKVSWEVTGVRQDKYAEAHRIPVEEEKPASEQGRYLHPDLYGLPESLQVGYDQRPRETTTAPARGATGARRQVTPAEGEPEVSP